MIRNTKEAATISLSLLPSHSFFLPSASFRIAAFILGVREGNRGSENVSVEPRVLHPRGDFIRSSGAPPLCSFCNDERDRPLSLSFGFKERLLIYHLEAPGFTEPKSKLKMEAITQII